MNGLAEGLRRYRPEVTTLFGERGRFGRRELRSEYRHLRRNGLPRLITKGAIVRLATLLRDFPAEVES